jgi:hypothetical protein
MLNYIYTGTVELQLVLNRHRGSQVTVSDQLIDLIPSTTPRATNAFSLANLPAGVYTLDLITQKGKGNTRAAYEGILVISQQITIVINETTRNAIS